MKKCVRVCVLKCSLRISIMCDMKQNLKRMTGQKKKKPFSLHQTWEHVTFLWEGSPAQQSQLGAHIRSTGGLASKPQSRGVAEGSWRPGHPAVISMSAPRAELVVPGSSWSEQSEVHVPPQTASGDLATMCPEDGLRPSPPGQHVVGGHLLQHVKLADHPKCLQNEKTQKHG